MYVLKHFYVLYGKQYCKDSETWSINRYIVSSKPFSGPIKPKENIRKDFRHVYFDSNCISIFIKKIKLQHLLNKQPVPTIMLSTCG